MLTRPSESGPRRGRRRGGRHVEAAVDAPAMCWRGQAEQRQQHLYLVVDDWERGYTVRKIDVDAFRSAAGVDPDEAAEPLPEPPVVRFEGHHGNLWYFGAHGTKILAMPPAGATFFPVFDAETLGLALCAYPGGGASLSGRPFFASVAGRLYMMCGRGLAVLDSPPPPNSHLQGKALSWTWAPSPLPFEDAPRIGSWALHSDGRTLFVSADASTFSLDTESLRWTCQGSWLMPFRGQAFFDDELNAWVGLCRHKAGVGHVCSCDVAAQGRGTLPEWKLSKDQLFCADSERHLGAKLLSMGDSNYCLVELLRHKDNQDVEQYPGHRVFFVTTFGLKYDKNGELRTTRRRAQSYEMTDAHEINEWCFVPVAFWM